MDILSIPVLQMGTGIFWTLAYILIIRQGSLDKMSGIPMAALCANISWEFVFSFIYPHAGLQRMINITWFTLDAMILLQYINYGRKDFRNLPAYLFYLMLILTTLLSLLIILASASEFNDYEGKYAAFAQNLMMSVLFISLLVKRGNTKGQSIYIGFFKMFGSFLAALAFFLYFRSDLITVLSVSTLLFDLIYIAMFTSYRKREKFNLIARDADSISG